MHTQTKNRLALTICLMGLAVLIMGADYLTSVSQMRLSVAMRNKFWNPDGSCVQCSIGMCGISCNDPNAAMVLWDTKYGKAIRGGSWPARVAAYFQERGIKGWNVTGEENTFPWMMWAIKTRRFAAIGAGSAHFQTLYGYDFKRNKWLVCNNQTPGKIDEYDEAAFRRLHMASGPWIVVLAKPASEPPEVVEWWL